MYTYEHQINAINGNEATLLYEAKTETQAKSIVKELTQKLGEKRFWDATKKPPQWVDS